MKVKKIENDRLNNILSEIAAIATIIGVVLGIVFRFGHEKLFQLFSLRPGWFWLRGFLIWFLFFLVSFICVWLWNPYFKSSVLEMWNKRPKQFFLKIISSLTIQISLAILIAFIIFQDRFPNQEAACLFPQLAKLGPVFIRNYASNGEAHNVFIKKTESFGPKECFERISFRLYGFTEQNAGFVIYFLRGADLSKYHELRFLIKGETGHEKIGIKAKDARGVEVQFPLEGEYLRESHIKTNWQEAVVPFSHFGNVQFNFMENFSFYTTGIMAGTHPQTFYVGDFSVR